MGGKEEEREGEPDFEWSVEERRLSAEEEESDCDGKGDEGGRVTHYVEDEVVCVA